MAFPQVLSVAHSQTSTENTSHTVTMPSGVASGDLLVAFIAENGAHAGASAPVFPAGWTRVLDGNANNVTAAWAYKVSDGTEGASITVTTTDSEQTASTVYRIEGHDSSTTAPQSLTYFNSGTNNTPNADNLTPTGGAKDYLWLWCCGADSGYIITTLPASFTNLETSDSGSGANTSAAMSTGRMELNAASHNAAAATLEGSEGYLCCTVAVHPGTEGNPAGGADILDPMGMMGFFGA